ncbi:MAG: hypothetical protein A4S17_00900 [Proteobacteria bacterium HN_bin10]|nr:MAG: hypothetical protein A4S17_00900 [Proteobacteria bacterium HN_bin10]
MRATETMRATRVAVGAIFATRWPMPAPRQNPTALRAEARVLTTAGLLLLGLGFPLTLVLVAASLGEGSASPFMPLAVGAPPIMLGYLACHFASQRMLRAKSIEAGHTSKQPRRQSASTADLRLS